MQSRTQNFLSLLPFILLVLGGGALIGAFTGPDNWYAALEKPAFNPPGWLFGPVWTTLYILIAIAGWRLWQNARGSLAMKLWWLQLVLNFAWSPAFFAAHQIGLALAIILALLVVILAFIASAWRTDRTAALLFIPYAAWVAFASALNGAILGLN
jgi:tryptophan-rich sensory protein